MCGICGIIYKDLNKKVFYDTLIKMRDKMIHRGPDDCGIYVNKNVGLAHRRLSIIDIESGHQPMSNEDGSIWITYNGEIYNFNEIKTELKAKGHIFTTHSDTEVIIHAYEEYGIDCIHQLNGMFSFAIWDSNEKILILVRDRLGIKPLYYAIWDGGLIFASEIKSILEYQGFPKEVNTSVIKEYITFRFISGKETLFKKVFNLLPGHMLIWRNGSVSIKKYWDINFEQEIIDNELFIIEELDILLRDSVYKRLISDVPLGTFNSGGIDSSLITALVCRYKKEPVHTFSVGFYEKEFDESSFAQLISNIYNTKHHMIKIDQREFAELLPKMIYHNDEPLCHPNSVLIYCISKLAKNYVTVVLTGEGSDELFAGYPRYFIPIIDTLLKKFPWALFCLKSLSIFIKSHRIKKIIEFASMNEDSTIMFNSSFVSPHLLNRLFGLKTTEFKYRYNMMHVNSKITDILTKLFFLDLKTYLVSILIRQDKMSMAAGIESRVPFLDHRIVEFTYKISSTLKICKVRTKYILKKYAKKYLPSLIINRKKSGFGVPLSSWLRNDKSLGQYLNLIYKSESGLYDKNIVCNLLKEKLDNDICELIWALINLELWYQIFIKV